MPRRNRIIFEIASTFPGLPGAETTNFQGVPLASAAIPCNFPTDVQSGMPSVKQNGKSRRRGGKKKKNKKAKAKSRCNAGAVEGTKNDVPLAV